MDGLTDGLEFFRDARMQFYIFVMLLGLPDDIHEEKPHFFNLKKKTHYGPTDGRTDGPTDGQTDRDARTHLKTPPFAQ